MYCGTQLPRVRNHDQTATSNEETTNPTTINACNISTGNGFFCFCYCCSIYTTEMQHHSDIKDFSHFSLRMRCWWCNFCGRWLKCFHFVLLLFLIVIALLLLLLLLPYLLKSTIGKLKRVDGIHFWPTHQPIKRNESANDCAHLQRGDCHTSTFTYLCICMFIALCVLWMWLVAVRGHSCNCGCGWRKCTRMRENHNSRLALASPPTLSPPQPASTTITTDNTMPTARPRIEIENELNCMNS